MTLRGFGSVTANETTPAWSTTTWRSTPAGTVSVVAPHVTATIVVPTTTKPLPAEMSRFRPAPRVTAPPWYSAVCRLEVANSESGKSCVAEPRKSSPQTVVPEAKEENDPCREPLAGLSILARSARPPYSTDPEADSMKMSVVTASPMTQPAPMIEEPVPFAPMCRALTASEMVHALSRTLPPLSTKTASVAPEQRNAHTSMVMVAAPSATKPLMTELGGPAMYEHESSVALPAPEARMNSWIGEPAYWFTTSCA
jgi:hypothetical protein